MKYDPINPSLFKLNRNRFIRKMKPESIAIFHSNDRMPRTGDTTFPFRQNTGLFYLSGLDQEDSVVVLFPDCKKDGYQELAFIRRPSEKRKTWEGAVLSKEEATAISGIEKVFYLEEMDGILRELILLAKRIYLNVPEQDRFESPVLSRDQRYAQELMHKFPLHKYHRTQPILRKMQMIKMPEEVELIRRAIDITHRAFQRVLEFVAPGVWEFEVEAEITHEIIRGRASGHAYEPIIAAGNNACVLHYVKNENQCQAGDLLLMDFGAEYANYVSDLSRTIPVNGQFSDRQRKVYQAVLNVFKFARQGLVPGITLEEYQKEVGKQMESELLALGLLDKTDIKNQSEEKPAYKKYFMHGVSHHLGLDVHDLSNRYDPFQAGMVFTCEPGIYLPDEKMGIRLENDILITDDGPVDLMKDIPIEAEAIEELMNSAVLN